MKLCCCFAEDGCNKMVFFFFLIFDNKDMAKKMIQLQKEKKKEKSATEPFNKGFPFCLSTVYPSNCFIKKYYFMNNIFPPISIKCFLI